MCVVAQKIAVNLGSGEVAAVKVGTEAVEAAQGGGVFQFGGGLYIDRGALLAAKGAAVLRGDEDLFMLEVK